MKLINKYNIKSRRFYFYKIETIEEFAIIAPVCLRFLINKLKKTKNIDYLKDISFETKLIMMLKLFNKKYSFMQTTKKINIHKVLDESIISGFMFSSNINNVIVDHTTMFPNDIGIYPFIVNIVDCCKPHKIGFQATRRTFNYVSKWCTKKSIKENKIFNKPLLLDTDKWYPFCKKAIDRYSK